MKIVKFNDFLNENTNTPVVDVVLKRIKFRDHDLSYWLTHAEGHSILTTDDVKKIEANIDVLIETFETYNEDENPDQYVYNKKDLIDELSILGKVLFQVVGKIDLSIFQAYISDNIIYRERWKDSTILVDTNTKTGVFDS